VVEAPAMLCDWKTPPDLADKDLLPVARDRPGLVGVWKPLSHGAGSRNSAG
jgi:hypothetical protein